MNEDNDSPTFDYIWIIRCAGTNVNYNVEYRLIPEAPQNGMRLLLEVIDEPIFASFTRLLRQKYGEIMVDFPLYLLESNNKFFGSFSDLSNKYPNQEAFFTKFKNLIDIPVISARQVGILDYINEKDVLLKVKKQFERVAVRVRVPAFNLQMTPTILASYKSLLTSMNDNDILLLDVFNMIGIENQINMNLELMSKMGKKERLEVFTLNAFEPIDLGHNFGPLFSYSFNLNGFGDFATEKRFPAAGGRATRRIIRYYYWDRYMLKEIAHIRYQLAASQLRISHYWTNHQGHVKSCNVCLEVQNNRYNEGHSYWKRFRILHYLNSVLNETRQQYSQAISSEDLDPDGYDLLYNVGES